MDAPATGQGPNVNQPTVHRLKILGGLRPELYQHPLDSAALKKLKGFPGFETLVRKFWDLGLDKVLYLGNVSSRTRITPKQYPDLHRMVETAATVLDVPVPEVYIELDPQPNAMAIGINRPSVVLTTGLLQSFPRPQILYVIGHEIGHIKSAHVLYLNMATYLGVVTEIASELTLGLGGLVGTGLQLALLEWARKSEFTADRASLLVVQDLEVVIRGVMLLAGAHVIPRGQESIDEFVRQAEELEGQSESITKFWKWLILLGREHPFAVLRASELIKWHKSGAFESILNQAAGAGA